DSEVRGSNRGWRFGQRRFPPQSELGHNLHDPIRRFEQTEFARLEGPTHLRQSPSNELVPSHAQCFVGSVVLHFAGQVGVPKGLERPTLACWQFGGSLLWVQLLVVCPADILCRLLPG